MDIGGKRKRKEEKGRRKEEKKKRAIVGGVVGNSSHGSLKKMAKRLQEEEQQDAVIATPKKRTTEAPLMENAPQSHLFLFTKANHPLEKAWLEQQKQGNADLRVAILLRIRTREAGQPFLSGEEMHEVVPRNKCHIAAHWDDVDIAGNVHRTVLFNVLLMEVHDMYEAFMQSKYVADVSIGPEALSTLRKHLGGSVQSHIFVVKVIGVPEKAINTIAAWPSSGLSVRIYKEHDETYNVLYTTLGTKSIKEIGDQAARYGLKAFTPPSMNMSEHIVTVKTDAPASLAINQLCTLKLRNSKRKLVPAKQIREMVLLSQDIIRSSCTIVGSKLALTGLLAEEVRADLNHRQKKVIGNVTFTPCVDENTTVKITVERE